MNREPRFRGPGQMDVVGSDGIPLGRIVCVWRLLGEPSFTPDRELRANLGVNFDTRSLSAAQRAVRSALALRSR